ncbi:MAG TPA: YaeQ family protein [Caldilineaceae bacterium]|nr:YaeQ family protein [Caldilineaceae bacterium]
MALSATIYTLTIELADTDRGVYETLDLRLARQPSESTDYLLMRILAYSLEYTDGIELTEGVAAGDDPAVYVRDLTGQPTAWIEVGLPDADRLHRGSKRAGRAAVYTHRDVSQLLRQLNAKKIHQAESIPIYEIDGRFVKVVAAEIDRRSIISIAVTDRELYITVGDQTWHTTVVEHQLDAV